MTLTSRGPQPQEQPAEVFAFLGIVLPEQYFSNFSRSSLLARGSSPRILLAEETWHTFLDRMYLPGKRNVRKRDGKNSIPFRRNIAAPLAGRSMTYMSGAHKCRHNSSSSQWLQISILHAHRNSSSSMTSSAVPFTSGSEGRFSLLSRTVACQGQERPCSDRAGVARFVSRERAGRLARQRLVYEPPFSFPAT